jgi:hypothetical protein
MALLKDLNRRDLTFKNSLFESADAQLSVYWHNNIDARVYGLYIVFNQNYYQYYYSLSINDLIGNMSISDLSRVAIADSRQSDDQSYYATAG